MFRIVSFLLFFSCALTHGQSPTASPAFEVADVKLNKSGEVRMAVDFQPGGRFSARNVPLKILIALACHVRPNVITGGPGWLDSDRYDVVAKASQATPAEELRRMLRTLLQERFKLKLHTDHKMMTGYALLVAKSGPKLQPSTTAALSEQRCRPGETIEGRKHVVCEHMTLALLADVLQEIAPTDIDAPVVDQTNLSGAYVFDLAWTPTAGPTSPDRPDAAAGPSLFQVLQSQLGLRLERKKLPLPVIVVDGLERVPIEN